MNDIYAEEQKIYDDAMSYSACVKQGAEFSMGVFDNLADEYGRLLRQLRRVTKISDRKTVNLKTSELSLQDKVHFDALTGIYNRRFMEENLTRVIKSLARSGGELSVLMMDVDFFKKYNDTYGHSEGDNCLKSVAKTLASSLLRADDFAARYGGEEFVIVLPNTDEIGARYVAGNILENIRAKNIPHSNNDAAPYVTISIGVTTSFVSDTLTGTDYIKRADFALYQSKQNGRDRYTYINFEEELQ